MNCVICGKELEPGSSFCTACGSPQSPGLRITVGRDPGNDIPVRGERVSRRHAEITQTAIGLTISDLGSVNGTFVNGKRVSNSAIGPDDRIMLADQVPLDWRQIQDALQRKASGGQSGGRQEESEAYSPVFIQEAPLRRRHSRLWLYLVIAAAASAALFAAWYFLIRAGGNTYDKVNVNRTYTYKMKLGEDRDMSLTRARLETLEALLTDAADSLDTQNSLLANYCLLETTIHDDPVIKEPQDYVFRGNGEITHSATTSVSEKDYLAREEVLNSRQDYQAKIKLAGESLARRKQELKAAEMALVAWAQGEDGIRYIRRSLGMEDDSGEEQPQSTGTQAETSADLSALPRENYDKALQAYEEVFQSLEPLRKELLGVNAKNKRQKIKASDSGKT